MTKFGDDLIASMSEALAHARGENVPGIVVHEIDVDNIDPKAVRLRLRLTQERMAQVLGTSLSGYRKWEQQQRTPSGAARTRCASWRPLSSRMKHNGQATGC